MRFRSLVRGGLEQLLEKFGYSLKVSENPPRGYSRFLQMYRSVAPEPRTVFDIGVGRGTPWLYEAFPNAHFVLVEALEDFAADVDAILKRYDAECHYCCLGRSEGEAEFRVRPGVLTSSGLHALTADYRNNWSGAAGEVEQVRRVTMKKLDSLAADVARPTILKIDVEGSELEVLEGGVRTVESADMILVETSVTNRFEGGADLIQVGSWLKDHGFGLFEIVSFSAAGPRRITCYVDAAFVRLDSEAYFRLASI